MRILHIRALVSAVLICGIVGGLLSATLPAAALTVGDRCVVTAPEGLKVRDAAAGNDIQQSRAFGDRGNVVAGPTPADLGGVTYNWYWIFWDGDVIGWSADVGLAAAPNPTISVSAASNIATSYATLNGSVNPRDNDNICVAFFEYGTSASYGQSTAPYGDLGGNITYPVIAQAIGLDPDTLYHFTLTVEFLSGVRQRGADRTFITAAENQPPTVSTGSGTSQTESSALLGGTINPNGDSTDAWFEWGSTTSFGNITPSTAKGAGWSSVSHSETINGLAYGATYHFRVVAENSYGTSRGNDRTFTMPIQRPTVQTLAASNVQKYGASVNGTVNPNGNPCSTWFEWGTTTAYGNRTVGSSYNGTGTGPVLFSEAVAGLEPGKTYHFRIRASNSGGVSYGTDSSFQAQYRAIGPMLTVAPDGDAVFPSTEVGRTRDVAFTVFNSGSESFSGAATVAVPFSIVAGRNYTLSPGQTQTVTVRYTPSSLGKHEAYVVFTGGAGESRKVTGISFADPTPTTGKIAGRVTSAEAPNDPIYFVEIRAFVPKDIEASGGSSFRTYSGDDGSYEIAGLSPNQHYTLIAGPGRFSDLKYSTERTTNISVVAGQTTTQNLSLTPFPAAGELLPPEQTPVVLVRGTGKNEPWEDLEENYWGHMRLELQSAGFQRIWDCNEPDADSGHYPQFPVFEGMGQVINGENRIQINGWNLQYYVRQKAKQFERDNGYYPPSINIVAHSMGGLIARSAMIGGQFSFIGANGKWVDITVGKVVMLATPNAGSRLADLAITSGFHTDFFYYLTGIQPTWPATHDLSAEYIQGEFNGGCRWPTGVELFLLGGYGGLDSPKFKIKQGAYALAGLGWPGILPPVNVFLPDEQVNDGAVTWPSVNGQYWKRSFPQMDLIPYTSVSLAPSRPPAIYNLDHEQLLTSKDVSDWVISSLTANSLDNTATHISGIDSPSPIEPDDVTEGLPFQHFERLDGTIVPGNTHEATVASDAGASCSFQLLLKSTDVVFNILSPSGTLIDSATPNPDTNVFYSATSAGSNAVVMTYTINYPTNGIWRVLIDGSVISTQTDWSLMVCGDSSVVLLPQTEPRLNQGQDVVIAAALLDTATDPATPVERSIIGAIVTFPDGSSTNLALLDNGMNHDALPCDGVYAALLPNIQMAGDYTVSYRATATNSAGQALQRVANSTFSVSSENGSLWGDPAYDLADVDGDGVGDLLNVSCWVNPVVAADYILAGDLVNASGSRFGKSSQFSADGTGPMGVTLMFDLSEFRAAGGYGEYRIDKLQLFEVTSERVEWLAAYHGTSSIQLAPTITTLSPLPAGIIRVPYNQMLTATGGVPPYSWSVVSNSLPAGLSLDPGSGMITGTASVVQSTSFMVRATGNDGLFSTATLSLAITPPLWFVSPDGNDTNTGKSWSAPKQTIQAAIDCAVVGDEVVVSNGVYDTGGVAGYPAAGGYDSGTLTNRVAIYKPITVRSVNGAAVTIIKGQEASGGGCGDDAVRCAYVANGAALVGFTLTNGATLANGLGDDSHRCGGGALNFGVVSNCLITGNVAASAGGGSRYGVFYNCYFFGNSAIFGGGVSSSVLYNCVVTGNSGGGADWGELYNCTVTGNNGGGANASELHNCIVYHNNGGDYDPFIATASYSCTVPMTPGPGNLTNEPCFMDYAAGDLRLNSNSPCINAGQNQSWMEIGIDLAGTNRMLYGTVDMGAYEYSGPLPPIPVRRADLSVPTEVLRTNQTFSCFVTQIVPAAATENPMYYTWVPEPESGQCTTQAFYNIAIPGRVSISVTASNSAGGVTVAGSVQIALDSDTYVSSSGDDANSGFSEANAKRTIQAAVDATLAGYTVWVDDGVYSTGGKITVNYAGSQYSQMNRVVIDRPMTVRSVHGPNSTMITGQRGMGDAVVRGVWMTDDTALIGFTVSNGSTSQSGSSEDLTGGGVWCASTNVVLSNCVLEANSASAYGGGVYQGTLYNCVLRNNSADDGGGGAYLSTLYGSVVSGNAAMGSWWGNGGGGALDCELFNCTLTGNRADTGGGSVGGILRNCIVYYNTAPNGANWSAGDLTHCCTMPLPGGAGNMTNEPGIVSVMNPRLLPDSFCVDRGTNMTWMTGATDIEGDPRLVNLDVDIGADELWVNGLTGTISGAVSARYARALPGYSMPFSATLDGRIAYLVLDYGDGVRTEDIINLEHAYAAIGSYDVVLTATNLSCSTSWTTTVEIIESADNYVSTNGNDLADGTSWSTAKQTLQTAVDFVPPGGTLWVSNGIYAAGGRLSEGSLLTNRMVLDKPITVRSVNGPAVTIIVGQADLVGTNGDSAVRCVWMGNETALIGLTLSNGHTRVTHDYSNESNGGGVLCASISAVLSNCVLTANGAGFDGGGVYGGTLYNCLLTGNSAVYGGGADNSKLFNSVLVGNCASRGGGAVSSNSKLYNCTLTGNEAAYGGGAYFSTLENCVVYYNTASNGANFRFVDMKYSCTTPDPGGTGNITNEPGFVNIPTPRLLSGSQCINAGVNQEWMTGAVDMDGTPRIVGGIVDMGAYESANGKTSNGIPWGWLLQYHLETDGSADCLTAGNGMLVWQNWVAGCDPTNPASVFRVTHMDYNASSGLVIRWPSISNRFYNLSRSTNLLAGTNAFTILPGASNMPATPTENCYTDTVQGVGPYYYKIDVRE